MAWGFPILKGEKVGQNRKSIKKTERGPFQQVTYDVL